MGWPGSFAFSRFLLTLKLKNAVWENETLCDSLFLFFLLGFTCELTHFMALYSLYHKLSLTY